jgi:hypothetical protein
MHRNSSGSSRIVGGGAIAVRNCETHIRGSDRENQFTLIVANRCERWAGGAVCLQTISEGSQGALASVLPDFYQAFLNVFEFGDMNVCIDGNVQMKRNEAGRRPSSAHGKGGALYIQREGRLDLRELYVSFRSIAANTDGNVATGPRVPSTRHPTTWPTHSPSPTDLFNLYDSRERIDDGDDQLSSYLSGGDFIYDTRRRPFGILRLRPRTGVCD